ncbi:MAG: cytochrome c oxidase subunit IV [Acidobacteria bacterium]|nr:cytochrome c oxidase subunit IV [Acidobacteriota bacterium]
MSHHADSHAGHDVHGGPKLYGAILAGLLFLTIVTVGAAYVDFGSSTINIVIAMTIATIKGSLVCLYFMHLRWDKVVNAVVFLSSLVFLAFFITLCLIDVESRDVLRPANWTGQAPTPIPSQVSNTPEGIGQPPKPLPKEQQPATDGHAAPPKH